MVKLFILFESALGFGLFERLEVDEIGDQHEQVQNSINDFGKFSKMVKIINFTPFPTPEDALENINSIADGEATEFLKNFLETHLPSKDASDKKKDSKKKDSKKTEAAFNLGVGEEKLAGAIAEALSIKCQRDAVVAELLRGIRKHLGKFIPGITEEDIQKAQLGLAHSFSRCKVKFNINRVDNMIIQSICLLDQLDKDVNTFAMRIREWYSWHFPELVKVVPDNYQFAKLVRFIKNKASITEESVPEMDELSAPGIGKQIFDAARASMGTDISDFDLLNICQFATRVINLAEYRAKLHDYLVKKMNDVAPNLSSLIGELVGARLISHAGSLTSLAKYPASTVQILGAEKALFRALKTRGNTPKYGLLYNSTFISRASTKDKGRISRYLANKCSIASRCDAFSDVSSSHFGKNLREQVEERLRFYESGVTPRKNSEVMKKAKDELKKDGLGETTEAVEEKKESKKSKKDSKKSEEPVEKKSSKKRSAEVVEEKSSKKQKTDEKSSKKEKKEEKPSKKEKKEKDSKKKKSK
eukprot:TRINITY_DN309_c2_g2_i1.p1 TRINITY_DN309_c2_g2~~TRINITY_DN309_c2_g2_i1.p1  ORF type:complete len:530 (+),score=348.42 TRINITY_DN309_c2_g2_i1:88-1677(+)